MHDFGAFAIKEEAPFGAGTQETCFPLAPRMSRSKIDDVPENLIRIGNKLYDAGKIEAWHPGGKIYIQV